MKKINLVIREKGLLFEMSETRFIRIKIYLVILGQIDSDNSGISGVEKYFDKDLKQNNTINSVISWYKFTIFNKGWTF